LNRYFLRTNVPKKAIKYIAKRFWRDNPKDVFFYNQSDIVITKYFKYDSCYASVSGKSMLNYTALPIRVDLKFNKYAKIFYIRGFNEVGFDSTNANKNQN
jgi:hypothetical protein